MYGRWGFYGEGGEFTIKHVNGGAKYNGIDEDELGNMELIKDDPSKDEPIKDAHDGVRGALPCLGGGMRNGGTPPEMGGRPCFLRECC